MEKAIVVNNISKKYKLYKDTKERLLDLVTPKNFGDDFYALTNVSFEATHGEVLGFVGVNGSGKSTLANIIAGIVPETSGTVKVNGQVALIAVAAGLKNDLTGRDNIELKLLMLGFNKEEIKALESEIIEFSELGKFIDQPVKSYSSGMKSRLGFAISVNVNPDILIIDEALSVGDKAFAEKSLEKMKEFKRDGKTMIFVSHSIGQMKKFCQKILWLEFGMVKDFGTVEEVIPKYESFLETWQKFTKTERETYKRKAFENQQKILVGEKVKYDLEIKDFYQDDGKSNYIEKPVSYLGHIRAGESNVYSSPKQLFRFESSEKLKHSVYFIKKQAVYNDEIFYLISKKPSTVDGIVGWMKASDLSVHRYIAVDTDPKSFQIKGEGKAYELPWGGKKNLVFEDLSLLKKQEFSVLRTDLVGNHVWHQGLLNGELVWINEIYLKKM